MKPLTWAAAAASGLLTLSAAVPADAWPLIVAPVPYDEFYGPVIEPEPYYFWGSRRYCWYFDGWRGPGWYW
ncbi:MAG: hypothetical protein JWR43_1643, partial [Phenylobacterium sp.]|nr:hypothetical protein [Phenylobacterium sp.]